MTLRPSAETAAPRIRPVLWDFRVRIKDQSLLNAPDHNP